jgi:hypothetical protein
VAQFNRRLSGLDIVRQVCGQLGLPQPITVMTDPGNRTAAQMWFLLNDAGQRLIKPVNGYRWQVLKRTWTLVTVPGQTQYPLPVDFDSSIDQTARSNMMLPPVGPVSDQAWAFMTARTLGPTTSLAYRIRGDLFEIYSSPDTPQTLLIDYSSRGWAQATAGGVYGDTMTADDDVCLYDAQLITTYLKLRFMQEKGFDTTVTQNDFDLALEMAINTDSDAPMLSGDPGAGVHLIGVDNIPDTGVGL